MDEIVNRYWSMMTSLCMHANFCLDESPIKNVIEVLDIEEDIRLTMTYNVNLPPTDFTAFDANNSTFNDEEIVDHRVSDCEESSSGDDEEEDQNQQPFIVLSGWE